MNIIQEKSQDVDSNSSAVIGMDDYSSDQDASDLRVIQTRTGIFGLTSKLLLVTLLVAVICELAVLIPSITNFQNSWINDKLYRADLDAKLILAIKPNSFELKNQSQDLSQDNSQNQSLDQSQVELQKKLQDDLQIHLLDSARAEAIAVIDGQTRKLIAMRAVPPDIEKEFNLNSGSMFSGFIQSMDTLLFGSDRVLQLTGNSQFSESSIVEIIIMESYLRTDLINFTLRILGFSIPILIVFSLLLFFLLQYLFVRPVQRLSVCIERFAENPEESERIIIPSVRTDEIGLAEQSLANMEHRLVSAIQEHRRLANLGLAVSKINHDLRNILATAQLLLERLEDLPDPTVQRLAPKIISTLDRAVSYTRAVLDYGKTSEAAPKRELIHLSSLVNEVGEGLSLDTNEKIEWKNEVSGEIEIDADPDHMFRVLMNLCQNSLQALESTKLPVVLKQITVSAQRHGSVVQILVADSGPGVPYMVRNKIFHAFQSSLKSGGYGLGLSIAAELVKAHGGNIVLKESDSGANFEISIPDRPIDISSRMTRSQKRANVG